MKRRKQVNRAVSVILACMMLLEAPLSVTASDLGASEASVSDSVMQDGRILDAEDGADVILEDSPEGTLEQVITADEAETEEITRNDEAGAEAEALQGAEADLQGLIEDPELLEETEAWKVMSASEEEIAAQTYLTDNYVTNNKVITTGGDGVVKSEDGLTYNIGLKTPSGSTINSLRLKNEGSTSSYISGWELKADAAYLQSKTATATGSRSILSRPTGEAYSFAAVLSLYAAGTDKTTIDNGAAIALASQEFTFVLEPEAATYQVTFQAVDKDTKEVISGAVVSLEKDWSAVAANSDGSYSLPGDATYTVKAAASGYQDYSNASFQATESGIVKLEMAPVVMSTIIFAVKDSSGATIENPQISVKQGYYTTINAEADGSYNLQNGVSYSYTVTAANYSSVSGTIVPTETNVIPITLDQNITTYKVTFEAVVQADQTPITGIAVVVTCEEEDDWGETTEVTVEPETDGTYLLNKGTEYTYTVTTDGYKPAAGTLNPDGTSVTLTKTVFMSPDVPADPADQAAVDAVKDKFDSEFSAIRPVYGTDTNAAALVQSMVQAYPDVTDAARVTVALNTTDDSTYVAEDGTIHYVQADMLNAYSYIKNVSCTFVFRCGNAEAVSGTRTVTVCWDRSSFEAKMETEANQLTADYITNTTNTGLDLTGVTADFLLPQCMGTSLQKVWSVINWDTSDSTVISLEDTGYGSKINEKKAVLHPQENDTTVTLTAKFIANDTLLNSYVEKRDDFKAIAKTFEVTVKGSGAAKPTEEELLAILNQYYTADLLTDFVNKTQADLSNCQGDIQLPRYTQIKDEQNNFVFENREITVTSENTDIITITGYRANVDIFQEQVNPVVNLVITFTRDGVTAVKKIPVTVGTITDEMLDAEIAMMDAAKAHYFDGINDGHYTDADSVTGDLHAFAEMTLDEQNNPVWAYAVTEKTGKGIVPDDYFTDSVEMETNGYNYFKSSDPTIIKHENLLVTRPEQSTQVTISTLLSSERYGKFATLHPDNQKLKKLYKQEASATVTVVGTKTTADFLKEALNRAQALLDTVVEGSGAGEYPAGTKASLQAAIDSALAVQNKENVTDEELTAACQALEQAYQAAADSQNVEEASITISVTKDSSKGQPDTVVTALIKADAAAKAGYTKPAEMKNKVTVLDALVVYHQITYGEDFTGAPTDYLVTGDNGSITKIFGIETYNLGYYVNNKLSAEYSNACVLTTGDTLNVFLYGDSGYGDKYVYLENGNQEIQENVSFKLSVKASGYDSSFATVTENGTGCVVTLTDEDGQSQEATAATDGTVTFTAAAGSYTAQIESAPYSYYVKAAPITIKVKTLAEITGWEGDGTQAAPYLLKTQADMAMLAKLVNEQNMTFAGQYLKMAADITLPGQWTPIGIKTARFGGSLDGDNHLLTVPAGEKCLLGYTSQAELKNLNIYGTQIASEGVVDNYETGVSNKTAISIDHVTLKAGTQTLNSGFIGGYASGSFAVNITNSTVEAGVVIGYDKSQSNIGSFGGDFNGTISGCTSAATVYGVKYVGGICGNKGQTMGTYRIENCQFTGTVIASDNYAGGISGGGYGGTRWGEASAANTPGVTIRNCTVNAVVTGADYVGGILGSETGMVQCWENGIGYIQNNTFTGTVTATAGTYAGGVIGYINGLDKYNVIEGNKCFTNGGKAIGFIRYIDTSCAEPAAVDGVIYYNTENGKPSNAPGGATKTQHNRTDDPLGADADSLAKSCIRVTFSLLGDAKHDSDQDGQVHSLANANLTTWIDVKEYEVAYASNVKDLLEQALSENNMTWRNESGNYVQGITKDGVELAEFDNGRHSGWMYTLNGIHPEYGVAQQKLNNGDVVIFHYTDDYDAEHVHTWSPDWSSDATAHWHECVDWCPITDNTRKDGYSTHTWKTGTVTKAATCKETGSRVSTCSVCGYTRTETIPKLNHSYGAWEKVSGATVFAAEVQERRCSLCGEKETRTVGTKLAPTIKLSYNSLKLQTKQVTRAEKVSGLAAGDGVKSWKTSNSKVVKVSKSGVITAQNKTGKAVITVTLNSGKTAKINVTVQKAKVKTTKISLKTKVTIAKGKQLALSPVLSPITSQDKITYVSNNTKTATVNAKGVIRAKKAGTAKITVKSGSKKVVVTVTVPKTKTVKITGVPSSVTLKKGASKQLKAKRNPSGSDQKLTYASSNRKVVSVNANGKLTARKKGTAVITVKSGKVTVRCKVTVK